MNNDLFSIDQINHEDGVIAAILGINSGSDILEGHFPGHPVVPGACMLQVVKDTLERTLIQSLRLRKADQLKFMNMIDPASTSIVRLDVVYRYDEEGDICVIAKLSNPEVIYFKFQGSFIKT